MSQWGVLRPVRVGGLVAVGFPDENRIVVGSHNGLGILDASQSTRLDRLADPSGDYDWFRDAPPRIAYNDGDSERVVEAAGLWGGNLSQITNDGWSARMVAGGAVLVGPGNVELRVEDDDEPRACGFSPRGQVFVYATSATLYISTRSVD